MPEDHRYEAALAAARAIIRQLNRPSLPEHEKLALATYTILDAIRLFERGKP